MTVKLTDLGSFKPFPGENDRIYYHGDNHDYLDSGQEFVSWELRDRSNSELIRHNSKVWLLLTSYPNGEWTDTDEKIYYVKGDWSGHYKKVYNEGDPSYFEIPLILGICERCRGQGTMGNPAFNGTTTEWWQEHGGPDWQEDLDEYIHGDMYDVGCEFHCDQGKSYAIDWTYIIEEWKSDPEANNEYATEIREKVINFHMAMSDLDSESKWGY
jgi:hypothetical protein